MVTITKLYSLLFIFWFLPHFLLQGLKWAVLHVWTQNYPQNVGTCPGLPLKLLARNHFFQSDRPDPSLSTIVEFTVHNTMAINILSSCKEAYNRVHKDMSCQIPNGRVRGDF